MKMLKNLIIKNNLNFIKTQKAPTFLSFFFFQIEKDKTYIPESFPKPCRYSTYLLSTV